MARREWVLGDKGIYDKWFVHTPDGYTIHFSVERGGLCHRMPFVNMLSPPEDYITPTDNTLFGLPDEYGHDNTDGVVMVEIVRKHFEGFTAKLPTLERLRVWLEVHRMTSLHLW
jgi:hypothetical protein